MMDVLGIKWKLLLDGNYPPELYHRHRLAKENLWHWLTRQDCYRFLYTILDPHWKQQTKCVQVNVYKACRLTEENISISDYDYMFILANANSSTNGNVRNNVNLSIHASVGGFSLVKLIPLFFLTFPAQGLITAWNHYCIFCSVAI